MAMNDQDVLSFLRQRNAPLTNYNYNSVKQQLDANPDLRPSKGGRVADPSPSDSEYDGGLDLGEDAKIAHNTVKVKPGSDDAKSAHAPNGASREAGPASNASGDERDVEKQHGSDQKDAGAHASSSDGFNTAMLAALAGGGAGLAGAHMLSTPSGGNNVAGAGDPGAGGASVEPPVDMPSTAGGASVLDGHAPQATPAPGQGGVNPLERIAQLQADRFASDNGMPAAGSPSQSFSQMAAGGRQPQGPTPLLPPPTGTPTEGFVLPGTAPSSAAHPYPDNAPHGMMDVVSQHIKDLVGAGRMNEAKQLIMTLARQIHGL